MYLLEEDVLIKLHLMVIVWLIGKFRGFQMIIETVDHFLDRCYMNFIDDIVFVYPNKINIGKPRIMTIDQAKQYVNYLNQHHKEIII